MDCLVTAEFGYESYEEVHVHDRMTLMPLILDAKMSQSSTPHKLLNNLLRKFSIVSMLFFL